MMGIAYAQPILRRPNCVALFASTSSTVFAIAAIVCARATSAGAATAGAPTTAWVRRTVPSACGSSAIEITAVKIAMVTTTETAAEMMLMVMDAQLDDLREPRVGGGTLGERAVNGHHVKRALTPGLTGHNLGRR